MYRAFGWEAPQFAHLPLLLSPDGNGKLSKRDGDKYGFPVFPLDWVDPATGARFSGYREAGYLPEAFLNFLALLGWSPGNDREIFTREELAEVFSLERVGKSGVKFDKQKSVWFNSHYLHHTPADRLWPHLKAQLEQEGIALPSETYAYRVLDLVKEKLQSLNDLLHESRFFFVRPATYDRSVVEKNWNPTVDTFFADLESWLAGTSDYTAPAIEERFKTLAADHGLKPTVPMPVFRHALTAVKYGPTVFQIAETLGQTETTARLRNFLTFMHSAT
jgi:glutamyl-tRNA synthetase